MTQQLLKEGNAVRTTREVWHVSKRINPGHAFRTPIPAGAEGRIVGDINGAVVKVQFFNPLIGDRLVPAQHLIKVKATEIRCPLSGMRPAGRAS